MTDKARRPLLVIDGDSFAHRAYHGVPKSVRRRDGKGGGAILGFANFLLRFYRDEAPRAVLVATEVDDPATASARERLLQSGFANVSVLTGVARSPDVGPGDTQAAA